MYRVNTNAKRNAETHSIPPESALIRAGSNMERGGCKHRGCRRVGSPCHMLPVSRGQSVFGEGAYRVVTAWTDTSRFSAQPAADASTCSKTTPKYMHIILHEQAGSSSLFYIGYVPGNGSARERMQKCISLAQVMLRVLVVNQIAMVHVRFQRE